MSRVFATRLCQNNIFLPELLMRWSFGICSCRCASGRDSASLSGNVAIKAFLTLTEHTLQQLHECRWNLRPAQMSKKKKENVKSLCAEHLCKNIPKIAWNNWLCKLFFFNPGHLVNVFTLLFDLRGNRSLAAKRSIMFTGKLLYLCSEQTVRGFRSFFAEKNASSCEENGSEENNKSETKQHTCEGSV